jgi:hypothetical protein
MIGKLIAVAGFALALRASYLLKTNQQDKVFFFSGSSLILCLLGFLLS